MSLRGRLQNLENRPVRRPIETNFSIERQLQRKLALPLPADATNAEGAECLRLLVAAQARTRQNRDDTGGLDAVREYALSLHRKYGTEPD